MSEKRFTVRRDEKGAILIPNSILKDGEIIDEEEIVDLLNEQQATIRKLQDLCGESDGENAKLRIENKQLKRDEQLYAKEILRLKEELKQREMLKLGGDY